jgi:hypothetical protein
MKDNDEYIDLMEKYFEAVSKPYYQGGQLADARPQYHYLVGVTPEGQEIARKHEKKINAFDE